MQVIVTSRRHGKIVKYRITRIRDLLHRSDHISLYSDYNQSMLFMNI